MFNQQRTAFALTATVAIGYSLCAIVYAIFPTFALSLSQVVFHGTLARNAPEMTFGSYLVGLVVLCVVSYIAGLIFAWSYGARKVSE